MVVSMESNKKRWSEIVNIGYKIKYFSVYNWFNRGGKGGTKNKLLSVKQMLRMGNSFYETVPPQNSYIEILISHDSTRRWSLESYICHAGGALMNEISALINETPQISPAASTLWGYSEGLTVSSPWEVLTWHHDLGLNSL